MDYTLIYFFSHVIEGVVFYQYITTVACLKVKKTRAILLTCLGYLVMFGAFELNIRIVNVIVNLAIMVVLSNLLCHLKIWMAILHSAILYCFLVASEMIVGVLMHIISPDLQIQNILLEQLILYVIICKSLYYWLAMVISLLFKKSKIELVDRNIGVVSMIVVLAIIFISTVLLINIGLNTELPRYDAIVISIVGLLLLIQSFLYVGTVRFNQNRSAELLDKRLELQNEKNKSEYYMNLVDYEEHRQILVHDIKGHLYAIDEMSKQGQSESIHEYIADILKTESMKEVVKYSNTDVVNYSLNRYVKMFVENNIDFVCDLQKLDISFMKEADITALFVNLLDNAYEATYKNKSGYVEVRGYSDEDKGYCLLTIINSCATAPKTDMNGNYITTKRDKTGHGYGMLSIKKICDGYGGDIQASYDEESMEFTVHIRLETQ